MVFINENGKEPDTEHSLTTAPIDVEKAEGLRIARTTELTMSAGYWSVGSHTEEEVFHVSQQQQKCSCSPGAVGVKCRHLFAVEYRLMGEVPSNGTSGPVDAEESVEAGEDDRLMDSVEDVKEFGRRTALTGTVDFVNGVWHVKSDKDDAEQRHL